MQIDISDETLKDIKDVAVKIVIGVFTLGLTSLWKRIKQRKGVKVTMTYGKLWGYGLITSALTSGGFIVAILILKLLGIL